MIETDSTAGDAYATIGGMADFITRVELHGANADEYAKLHAQMAIMGFQTRIVSRDGAVFDLPTAMYIFNANALIPMSAEQVRDMARRAADATGRNNWVFTAAFNDAAWYLNTVQPG